VREEDDDDDDDERCRTWATSYDDEGMMRRADAVIESWCVGDFAIFVRRFF